MCIRDRYGTALLLYDAYSFQGNRRAGYEHRRNYGTGLTKSISGGNAMNQEMEFKNIVAQSVSYTHLRNTNEKRENYK